MTVECVGAPFTYRWPGGEVHLEPGKPVNLPEARALRLLDKAAGKVRLVTPPIAAGCQITWIRGDLTVQHGTVDFVHVYGDGIAWAFVTLGENWAAVNMKCVTRSGDA